MSLHQTSAFNLFVHRMWSLLVYAPRAPRSVRPGIVFVLVLVLGMATLGACGPLQQRGDAQYAKGNRAAALEYYQRAMSEWDRRAPESEWNALMDRIERIGFELSVARLGAIRQILEQGDARQAFELFHERWQVPGGSYDVYRLDHNAISEDTWKGYKKDALYVVSPQSYTELKQLAEKGLRDAFERLWPEVERDLQQGRFLPSALLLLRLPDAGVDDPRFRAARERTARHFRELAQAESSSAPGLALWHQRMAKRFGLQVAAGPSTPSDELTWTVKLSGQCALESAEIDAALDGGSGGLEIAVELDLTRCASEEQSKKVNETYYEEIPYQKEEQYQVGTNLEQQPYTEYDTQVGQESYSCMQGSRPATCTRSFSRQVPRSAMRTVLVPIMKTRIVTAVRRIPHTREVMRTEHAFVLAGTANVSFPGGRFARPLSHRAVRTQAEAQLAASDQARFAAIDATISTLREIGANIQREFREKARKAAAGNSRVLLDQALRRSPETGPLDPEAKRLLVEVEGVPASAVEELFLSPAPPLEVEITRNEETTHELLRCRFTYAVWNDGWKARGRLYDQPPACLKPARSIVEEPALPQPSARPRKRGPRAMHLQYLREQGLDEDVLNWARNLQTRRKYLSYIPSAEELAKLDGILKKLAAEPHLPGLPPLPPEVPAEP